MATTNGMNLPPLLDAQYTKLRMGDTHGMDIRHSGLRGELVCTICDEVIHHFDLDGLASDKLQDAINLRESRHLVEKHNEKVPVLTPSGWMRLERLGIKVDQPDFKEEVRRELLRISEGSLHD